MSGNQRTAPVICSGFDRSIPAHLELHQRTGLHPTAQSLSTLPVVGNTFSHASRLEPTDVSSELFNMWGISRISESVTIADGGSDQVYELLSNCPTVKELDVWIYDEWDDIDPLAAATPGITRLVLCASAPHQLLSQTKDGRLSFPSLETLARSRPIPGSQVCC